MHSMKRTTRLFRFFGFWLVLVGLLVLFFLPACTTTEPALRLTPDSSSAKVGQLLTITLQAENVSGLIAAEAHLAFDPTILEVVSIQHGSFLQPDFVVQNVFDNTAGTIDYAVAQLNRSAAEGSGALLVIEFRAKAGGDASIGFRSTPAATEGALLADADGSPIQVSLGESNVSVAP
jgi:hypothetical protein